MYMKSVTKLSGKVDLVANLMTVVVGIIFIALFTYKYVLPYVNAPKAPAPGIQVSFTDFDPSISDKNVILVMSKGCRFCEASMTFYRGLVEQNPKDTKFIAVFPTSDNELEAYLSSFGVSGIEIKLSDLPDLQIEGTPTLIVTDRNGKITRSWFGRLSPDKEKEVTSFLKS
jgi:thioredoxin-related protein